MLNPLQTAIVRGDCHPELPRSNEFHRSATYSGGSMSIEEAQFLFALVQIIKPTSILETGTEAGFSAAYMGLGCKLNRMGMVYTLELNPEWASIARENMRLDGVDEYVQVIERNSMEYIEEVDKTFQMCLLDTSLSIRSKELELLMPKLDKGAIIAVHDSSPLHPLKGECELLEELSEFGMSLIHLPSPRGLTILQNSLPV